MPAPRTPAARPGRRAVLRAGLAGATAAGVLALSGCRLRVGSPDDRRSSVPPEPSADQVALDRARVRADQLAALYAQAAGLRADLAPALRQLAADHTAHVQAIEALGGRPGSTGSGAPTATTPDSTAGSTAGSTPTSTTPPVLTAATALSALGRAERAAVAEGLADLGPVGPQAARLLASIAACGSAHVAVLSRLPRALAPAGTTTKASS